MTRLRVALLVDSPSRGTFANAVGRLAVGLTEAGRSETTLVSYREGPRAPWLPAEVRLHRLGTGRASRSVPALVRFLWTDRPDVLVSRQIHVNLIALAVSALARTGGRWRGRLVLYHDHPPELSHASNWRDNKWMVKLGYRFADGIAVPSPGVRDEIIRWCGLPPGGVVVVPNPITPFTPGEPSPPHPWLGEDTPVFLTVGHLFGWKRVDLVVDAIAGLRRRREARLLIVGEGLEKGRLDAQIQRHGLGGSAQTLGWVPDPREYARWATALVHASDEEGFAQVLIEAMSTHCPVIAVDALGGGPRFVTGEGRYGMLVPRGDSARLAGAMETMLESSVRERYAALGFQRSQCFSPRASAVALIDFLEMTRAAVEASAAMSEDRLSGAAWRDGSTSRTGSGSPV